ncbi:MAG: PTS sugar transporter subunit IIA [Candidatus Marinimicrobia bacterium]|nr:PTS sugar transporter subunit IIA [Candidatus Neomarinimicrobiota bacterium]
MDDIMTLNEVASYLRVSERTVYEWASKGELPCGKLGTSWRFKRSNIEEWVSHKLSPRIQAPTLTSPSLSAILKPERVVQLHCTTKEAVLNQLIDLFADIPELADAVFKREQLMSTGIGLSIAVPHVRLNSVNELHMAFGVNKTGINDYESLDNIPVRIIVLIVAGRDQHTHYLQTLSRVSHLLKNSLIREQLFEAKSSEEIYKIVIEGDNRL